MTSLRARRCSSGPPPGFAPLESRLQSPNIFTAVVVYDRPAAGGGFLPLTTADQAKAAADARLFADVPGAVKGQLAGPFMAKDGKAIETIVPVNLGSKGYDGAQPGPGPPGVVAERPGPPSCPRARPAEGTALARTVTHVRLPTGALRW